ncbi:MAG: UDP-N-acetylmuramoyl-tripeptide--D-alanyl-D-alanine ligase [Leptospiraceae bacterium]|nr:UDP-N-acetylmuramoyl-tripeptide--D-alanyl-D-alanine ligase [Leptospiraceae bacterium]
MISADEKPGHPYPENSKRPARSWSLPDMARALGVEPVQAGKDFVANGVSIDSRIIQPGDIFVCIRGDRTDGHKYIQQALAQGATALVVEEQYLLSGDPTLPTPADSIAVFAVEDGLRGLQDLARFHRDRLQGTIIGVTGSNGKTSAKEMLAGLCGRLVGEDNISYTQGNLNNHIGVPLSILRAAPHHSYVILEMGMNHAGEIELLSKMARPHYALITSIGSAHIEFFTSIEGIARAKLEILSGLQPRKLPGATGSHIFDPDPVPTALAWPYGAVGSAIAREVCDRLQVPLIDFALLDSAAEQSDHPARSHAVLLSVDQEGVRMAYKGRTLHNRYYFSRPMASNLLGCLTILHAAGVPLEDLVAAFAAVRPITAGRFTIMPVERADGSRQLIVDDSYNANPDSFVSALESLRRLLPAGKLAVFAGEMGELGEQNALEGHERVGRVAAQQNYALLAVSGARYVSGMVRQYQQNKSDGAVLTAQQPEDLIAQLDEGMLRDFDGILIKGSRAARMERVLEYINNLQS